MHKRDTVVPVRVIRHPVRWLLKIKSRAFKLRMSCQIKSYSLWCLSGINPWARLVF